MLSVMTIKNGLWIISQIIGMYFLCDAQNKEIPYRAKVAM